MMRAGLEIGSTLARRCGDSSDASRCCCARGGFATQGRCFEPSATGNEQGMNLLTRHRTKSDGLVEDPPASAIDDRPEGVDDDTTTSSEQPREPVLRIPVFSAIAPIGGWLAAWGAATLATAAVIEGGVGIGFGFGIADGSVDLDTGFWAGLWTLIIQVGAFVIGGYVAGRMARVRAVAHAMLAWFVAMAATAADAVVVAARDGGSSVLAPLRLPQWAGLDYENSVAIPLVVFALGALIGAILGGCLASTANRLETTYRTSPGPARGWRRRRV